MDFEYTAETNIESDGDQVCRLLHKVYVDGGYTDANIAENLFDPASVFDRGLIFSVKELNRNEIVGVLILVTSESKACRMAEQNEAELHLLAVESEFRGMGLGRSLVNAAINKAMDMGKVKLVLWTQESMKEARALYESLGFFPERDFEQQGRKFTLYHRALMK